MLSIQVTIILAILLLARRPPAVFWPWLLMVCIGAAIWSIAETATQFYSTDPVEVHMWVILLYTGLLLLITGWTPFVLSFASYVRLPFQYDSSALRIVLQIVPFLLWLTVVTNPFHGLFITPVVGGRNIYGPLWYVMSAYSYVCLVSSALLLASLLFRLEQHNHKVQTRIVLIGSLVPVFLNAAYLSRLFPIEADLSVVGMAFSSLMFVSAIYRYRLFALSPFTFHRLLEAEIDPYLVLDSNGKVVAFSKLAEGFFGAENLYFDCDGIKLVLGEFDVVGKDERRDEFSIHSITQSRLMEFEAKTWVAEDRGYYSISTNMVENRHGKVLGIGVRFRNVTELVQRTELVQQQATILEAILEATNDAILVSNTRGQVYYTNKAMKELWPFGESLSTDNVTPDAVDYIDVTVEQPDEFKHRLRELYPSDEVELNHRVDMQDGRTLMRFSRPFTIGSVQDAKQKEKGRIFVYHDITEHLRSEQEKSDLEKRTRDAERLESLGIMAGGVAHDFNNLLTVIVGRVECLLETMDSDSKYLADLKAIDTAGNQAIELTNQILSYTGDTEMQLRRLRFVDLLDQAMIVLQEHMSPKLNYEVDAGRDLWLKGDGSQLRQVLMNILQNGADAIGDDWGNLRVSARRESQIPWLEPPDSGDYLLIQISDDGDGIEQQMIEKIFDPFVTTKVGGRGLGLAAVQGIVKSHGGHLRVTSEPGSGTTFWLVLPALD